MRLSRAADCRDAEDSLVFQAARQTADRLRSAPAVAAEARRLALAAATAALPAELGDGAAAGDVLAAVFAAAAPVALAV